MFILLVILFSFCIFFFSLLTSIFQELQKPNTTFPYTNGPPSYPIIGCLVSFYQNRRRLLSWYTDLLSSSPTQTIVIKRLGSRRVIVTANTNNVKHMLKTNFHNFPKGKPFTDILSDLLGCGIFNVDGELWSTQRKLASHEFSARTLREFVVNILQQEVDNQLVPLLEEAVVKGHVLDLQDLLRRFAFNIVCRVSLGIDPFSLDISKPIPKLLKAFDEATEISALRGVAPIPLIWKAKRVLNVGVEGKLRQAIKVVHECVQEIIKNKKRVLEKGGDDLLSKLLLAGHDEEVTRDMLISFIIAGRDTTSSAMTWLFWLLSKHQNVEEMIVNEVETTLAKSGSEVKGMDFEVLKEWSFLTACLYESMRLYPPIAWDSKHALNDDILPDGTFVGKGDRVTYSPYGMGRMESLWGKDRLEFKPDRWFQEPDCLGGLKLVSPYKFSVFQAGPRACLGKEMALIQMKYVVASILKRFVVRPISDLNQPIFVPLLTAHMAGGLKIVVNRRVQNVAKGRD